MNRILSVVRIYPDPSGGRPVPLDRDVAIKILPEAFAHDADRLARFQREAKTLASLNHPNIAIIHGLEQAGDVHALVMELVEGEDLSQRIARGAIPLDEALPIAKQIAEALEAAHEQQIIHRDLKPANVKMREDGTVKVLDFGLAKAMDPGEAVSPHVTQSPTITTPAMTQAGLILGTAAYMSPDQASGRPVDKRADIWSFGVVLWEMLTGHRLFDGETVSHTLADVLRAEIDFSKLPTNTPTAIRGLLRRCLERDAKTRLRDIGEARVVIANSRNESEAPAVPVRRSQALPWALAATAALAIVATALGVVSYRSRTPFSQVVQKFSVLPPANATIDRLSLELAPDGHAVAFIATSAEGRRLLWVRSFEALSARPLQGTDDARYPFWSPDSRSLGFFAQKKLKRIQIAGGPPQTIGDAGPGLGGTWNRDDVIVFAPDNGTALYRVSANGGTRSPATQLDPTRRETAHFSPTFLPDGRHFLCFAAAQTRGINIGALDSTTSEHLIDADSRALYAPAISKAGGTATGHLVYVRDSTLLAQPFNAERRQITGDAVPIADGEIQAALIGAGAPFSIAEAGVLAYRSLSADTLLAWFDRAGRRLGALGGSDRYNAVEIASDSKRVALERIDRRSRAIDIWLLDVDGGRSSQFTFNGGNRPRWSSDGRFLSYDRSGVVFRKPADNSGSEEMLYQAPAETAFAGVSDWSPDGHFLVLRQIPRGTGNTTGSLWLLPIAADRPSTRSANSASTVSPVEPPTGSGRPELVEERKSTLIPMTESRGMNGRFSPDGRWLAYTSEESGVNEVFIQPFPSTGAKRKVSRDGGIRPRWRSDGKELFYIGTGTNNGTGRLMAVSVEREPTVRVGTPTPLMDVPFAPNNTNSYPYAVTADGQRFLVLTPQDDPASASITVVLNWMAELKK